MKTLSYRLSLIALLVLVAGKVVFAQTNVLNQPAPDHLPKDFIALNY